MLEDMDKDAMQKLHYLLEHGYKLSGVYIEKKGEYGLSSGVMSLEGKCKWFPYKQYTKQVYDDVVKSNN